MNLTVIFTIYYNSVSSLFPFQSNGNCNGETFLNKEVQVEVWERSGIFNSSLQVSKVLSVGRGCIDEIFEKEVGSVIDLRITSKIERMGHRAIQNLNNLTHVHMHVNNMKSIQKQAFFNVPNLQWLQVSGNSIEIIGKSTFMYLNVKVLILIENQIEHIHDDAFIGLSKLLTLFLGGNQLSEIKSSWFYDCNMENLHINDNMIQQLRAESFRGLTRLKYINLEENMITVIDSVTFKDLLNLKEVNLKSNYLRFLNPNTIFPRSLVSLNLGQNQLMYISSQLLENLSGTLKKLYINLNPLKCVCYEELIKLCRSYNISIILVDNKISARNYPICVFGSTPQVSCTPTFDEEAFMMYYKYIYFNKD